MRVAGATCGLVHLEANRSQFGSYSALTAPEKAQRFLGLVDKTRGNGDAGAAIDERPEVDRGDGA